MVSKITETPKNLPILQVVQVEHFKETQTMKIDPNNQAFPFSTPEDGYFTGLTIRAEFAKAAMVGLEANHGINNMSLEARADLAVKTADALIARLNQDES